MALTIYKENTHYLYFIRREKKFNTLMTFSLIKI